MVRPLYLICEAVGLDFFFPSRRVGVGKMELDREAAEKRAAWEELSSRSKITYWLVRHQYSIIFGSWLGACAVAGNIIWKNKYVTYLVKLTPLSDHSLLILDTRLGRRRYAGTFR